MSDIVRALACLLEHQALLDKRPCASPDAKRCINEQIGKVCATIAGELPNPDLPALLSKYIKQIDDSLLHHPFDTHPVQHNGLMGKRGAYDHVLWLIGAKQVK